MCLSPVLEELLCDKLKANSKSACSIDGPKGDSGCCDLE